MTLYIYHVIDSPA